MDDPDTFGDISRMHQKQITIHEGDEGLAETGRVLYVEPDWTTDDLLQAAGRRLELVTTPKRMFNCNGKRGKVLLRVYPAYLVYRCMFQTSAWLQGMRCSLVPSYIYD